MATLFNVDVRTINEHLKNIYAQREVAPESTIRKFRIVQIEGKREVSRTVDFYNLDAIISVGYRANSVRATQFRQWATKVLREFAIKGYVLDKKRMENGAFLGEDYFERLLEEIREIRLSERKFYQKITDIYATCSWSKFIVVVLSIAIREGVYKSFEITADHFTETYGKKVRFFIYNSKQLHHLESFSSDAGINVMVINIQAFNATGKDNRRIYDELDDFQSRRPIDVISSNRPIVILDEPQRVEFTNGHVLTAGDATGDITELNLWRIQIREAVRAHLEKEKLLFSQGIKVLSLFFIDQVVKYRDYSQPKATCPPWSSAPASIRK